MDEEGETPNLQPESDGLLATFSPYLTLALCKENIQYKDGTFQHLLIFTKIQKWSPALFSTHCSYMAQPPGTWLPFSSHSLRGARTDRCLRPTWKPSPVMSAALFILQSDKKWPKAELKLRENKPTCSCLLWHSFQSLGPRISGRGE